MISKKFYWKKKIIPCIVQYNGKVIMQAWINKYCFFKTIFYDILHYWSRSRKKIWIKGSTSFNFQIVRNISIDCDNDAFLINIKQVNNMCCHFIKKSCFNEIYKKNN
ncbi:phosphoribosyl-AMP cyclohydrolase [Candidatus Vidania fulgoroideae]|uniref:phosphoribosyl-AMP cyclohydrolase n=1 Tax=Candidatus Vidania fulgoroideorum TaxID=881286 RepID=A0AAX3N8L8_9PROT|nr:phosphoribosyl-AMP cyclohydrolase [Candidatus Vidania fulgoroideae]